jgi:membrane-associated phospholipid phosphatase
MGTIGVSLLFASVCINIKISRYSMEIFLELFDKIGFLGPVILNITSGYLLWDKQTLLFYYIFGVCFDVLLNLVLKGMIQQPRPCENIQTFNLALTHGKRFLFKNGLPYDIFGMPSGHAESVFFSTVFIYCALKKKYILYGYLFMSLIVISQRVFFMHHTPLQVFVGATIGSAFGGFVYYLARLNLKGHITEKLDDFGPI